MCEMKSIQNMNMKGDKCTNKINLVKKQKER